jgi:hypothetical protein
MVTDEEENQAPLLVPTLKTYSNELGVMPDVIIVKVGHSSRRLEQALEAEGMVCDTFTFSGDYYSLPSLLPLIAGGTRLDLLMGIMNYPMPERKVKQLAAAT